MLPPRRNRSAGARNDFCPWRPRGNIEPFLLSHRVVLAFGPVVALALAMMASPNFACSTVIALRSQASSIFNGHLCSPRTGFAGRRLRQTGRVRHDLRVAETIGRDRHPGG